MNLQPCPIGLPMSRMLPMQHVRYIAVHCSATPPAQDIGVREIDAMHRQRGFACIGYHYVIRRNGVIEKGRPDTKAGAHVEGFNARALGVCMIGGIDQLGRSRNNFTAEQFAALRLLLASLHTRFADAEIQGHRDFPKVAKDCPCFDVRAWLKEGQ